MGADPVLSILILTEDGGRHAHQTLQRLLIATFSMIEPGYQPRRLRFQEQKELGQLRLAVIANAWESRKAKAIRQKRQLRQLIANRLLEEPPGIVVFHFDGDQPWAQRDRCPRFANFEAEICAPVRLLIAQKAPDRVDEAMARLILITPFYSIEAWLYQNTDKLLRLLETHHQGQDSALVRSWAADRGLLDEVRQPKEHTCARDLYNEDLASGFPADAVNDVGKSYSETVERLLNCARLSEGLE